MDVHDKATRSYNMSCIRGANTRPEETVRKYLFAKGFRYRKNDRRFPGTPDIVLPKYKTVIFVNGCFWHKHEGCKFFAWPKNNAEFWKNKLEKNATRDCRNYDTLEKAGWRVMIVWEYELNNGRCENRLDQLVKELEAINDCNK